MLTDLASHAADVGVGVTFLFFLLAALGIPLPATIALIIGGAAIIHLPGGAGLLLLLSAAALAGTAVGDVVWFFVGRRAGLRALRLLCRISMSRDICVRQSEDFFGRHGVKIMLLARFVPGLSFLAVPMAGAGKANWLGFMVFDVIGIAAWIGCAVAIGVLFSREIDQIPAMLRGTQTGAAIAGGVAIASYLAFRWWHRRADKRAAELTCTSPSELNFLLANTAAPVVVDLRSPIHRELEPVAVPGALLARFERLQCDTMGLDRGTDIVTYCSCPNDVTAIRAVGVLRSLGFTNVRVLRGGFDAWREAGFPLQAIVHSRRLERGDGSVVDGVVSN
jgi:membrane protein DedA with SNARE-associated domain/rhodanese-related sulfurtransferase